MRARSDLHGVGDRAQKKTRAGKARVGKGRCSVGRAKLSGGRKRVGHTKGWMNPRPGVYRTALGPRAERRDVQAHRRLRLPGDARDRETKLAPNRLTGPKQHRPSSGKGPSLFCSSPD